MNNLKQTFFGFLIVLFILFPVSAKGETSSAETRKKALLFYNGIVAGSNAETSLPESHKGDPRLREWFHTYDASVCITALLAVGDNDRALKIMDFYVGNERIRRLNGVIEAVLNFSKQGKGINWQVRTGSNTWLGIASFHCYLATGNKKYLDFAQKQADFLIGFQDDNPMSATYGGVPLGPKGVSYNPKDQHILWEESNPKFIEIYSTEGNVDVWALLNMITSVSTEIKYKMAKARVEKWLRLVGFNAGENRMNRGYYIDPDMEFAPDTHFWTVSAFGPEKLEKWNPGLADQLMRYAKDRSFVEVTYKVPDGKKVKVIGYDFVDKENPLIKARGLVVSPEWTFQAAVAYSLLAEKASSEELAQYYLRERSELLDSILSMAEIKKGKAFLPYATKGDIPIGHEYNTPLAGTRSLIGSAWAILALLDYDPLNLEKSNNYWQNRK